jgi:hypothetical protein
MKQIAVSTLSEFKAKLESNDLEITEVIYASIKRGMTKKYKTVNVFDVQLREDPLNVYKFKLEKDQWSFALTKCLEVFSENEMYERCSQIQGLIKELEQVVEKPKKA